ncbi:hypothetical protein [Breoghania sp.]|uniref:hypothetical protein n=1 Tax=Breoghania sp. TaxID=2065378 RepID=UPI002AA8C8C4|nr:hypothetical protein [Breoghania sp.]
MEYVSIYFFSQWEFLQAATQWPRSDADPFSRFYGLLAYATLLPFLVAARLLSPFALLGTAATMLFVMGGIGFLTGSFTYALWLPEWVNGLQLIAHLWAVVLMLVVLLVRGFAGQGRPLLPSRMGQVAWVAVACIILAASPIVLRIALTAGTHASLYSEVDGIVVAATAVLVMASTILLILPAAIGYVLEVFPSTSVRRVTMMVLGLPWLLLTIVFLLQAGRLTRL